MAERILHIVSFDVPYPPDYGGVIDVYYKIKALSEQGTKVILHAFYKSRGRSPALEELCSKVYYYPRKRSWLKWLGNLPYIVFSRSSAELLRNLRMDDQPILFEGLHSCFYLDHPDLHHRFRMVRMHNIEHAYYRNLGKVERSLLKRRYFFAEADRLENYEHILRHANAILAISKKDHRELSSRYKNVYRVSAFHPDSEVSGLPGKGEYALYHGNLEVGENEKAARWLVEEVFSALNIPLIVAGNNPSDALKHSIAKTSNIKLASSVSSEEIYKLIRNAHVNVLPTFQATGIKLKLLAALYKGRYCLVNTPMIQETGLEGLCYVADGVNEMRQKLKELFQMDFKIEELERRRSQLGDFDNVTNVRKLLEILRGNQ